MHKKIVFSIDLSGELSWAMPLKTALVLCRPFGASLHLVHVIADVSEAMVKLHIPDDNTEKLV